MQPGQWHGDGIDAVVAAGQVLLQRVPHPPGQIEAPALEREHRVGGAVGVQDALGEGGSDAVHVGQAGEHARALRDGARALDAVVVDVTPGSKNFFFLLLMASKDKAKRGEIRA